MNTYAQNAEDLILGNWFGEFKGNLLSIGENSGITLSNALAFIEQGWSACLVEPSERCFDDLYYLHFENPNVQLIKAAISDRCGKAKFYESNEHLSKDDWGLLSTLNPEEMKRWPKQKFIETEVDMIDFEELMKRSRFSTFEYITIDAESHEYVILPQINFDNLETIAVIIEWNGNNFDFFSKCFTSFGFTLLDRNLENLIWTRK